MSRARVSARSSWGLNGANFFLAEMVGVNLPFLAAFLKQAGWNYSSVGIAVAAAGLGTLLFQAVAGSVCDFVEDHRRLLAATSLILGLSFAVVPVTTAHPLVLEGFLFLSGIAGSFFVPLLATLALNLVGAKRFDRFFGTNQSFNHAGNIAAALAAFLVVKTLGVQAIFYLTGIISVLAAVSVMLIRKDDLEVEREHSRSTSPSEYFQSVRKLFRNKTILALLAAVALFHLANAPAMPLLALYLKSLGGSDGSVAWVVLIAQVVMIPVAFLAGKFGSEWGRKPVFTLAFVILPVRLFLYLVTKDPHMLLVVQALDGIGAGIYGVVIALICRDLTQGKGGFNLLMGIAQTALAVGGFIGPLAQGFLTEGLGFAWTFALLGVVASLGAVIFIIFVPETGRTEKR